MHYSVSYTQTGFLVRRLGRFAETSSAKQIWQRGAPELGPQRLLTVRPSARTMSGSVFVHFRLNISNIL